MPAASGGDEVGALPAAITETQGPTTGRSRRRRGRRWRPRDGLYLAVGFVFPLLGPRIDDPLQSTARYLIVVFPLFVALALLLWRPVAFLAAAAASAVALCGLLSPFAQAFFVA